MLSTIHLPHIQLKTNRLVFTLAIAIPLMNCFPASATGFLDIDNGWSGASICSNGSYGCVENLTSENVTLIGYANANSQLTYVSKSIPIGSPGYTNIAFTYAFDAQPNQTAFYSIAGSQVILDSTGGSYSSVNVPVTLVAGQAFGFGVANGDTNFYTQLDISNFSYTPVPAPLPLLSAGATFGWIRRRRSVLRNREAQSKTVKSNN